MDKDVSLIPADSSSRMSLQVQVERFPSRLQLPVSESSDTPYAPLYALLFPIHPKASW